MSLGKSKAVQLLLSLKPIKRFTTAVHTKYLKYRPYLIVARSAAIGGAGGVLAAYSPFQIIAMDIHGAERMGKAIVIGALIAVVHHLMMPPCFAKAEVPTQPQAHPTITDHP